MTDQAAINRCSVCDQHGTLPSGRPCNHTAATATAVQGAARARAAIRPTRDTTPRPPAA